MAGPDIVMETLQLTTSSPEGCTKIAMSEDGHGNIKPKSLVAVAKEQCEKGDTNLIALKIKRGSGKAYCKEKDGFRNVTRDM